MCVFACVLLCACVPVCVRGVRVPGGIDVWDAGDSDGHDDGDGDTHSRIVIAAASSQCQVT